MMRGGQLTRRQREVFDYVLSATETRGYAPTLEEIAGHLGLRSVSTVWVHVDALQAKGFLKKPRRHSQGLSLGPLGEAESKAKAELQGTQEAAISKAIQKISECFDQSYFGCESYAAVVGEYAETLAAPMCRENVSPDELGRHVKSAMIKQMQLSYRNLAVEIVESLRASDEGSDA